MKNIRIFVGVVVLLLLIPVGFLLIFKRVPPDVIGVKQLRWGGGGILSEDFHAGFKVGISGLHLWHYLPRQTHFLHFSRSSISRGAIDSWEPAQEIRTTDNNVVSVDLSIPYRIVVGKGHRIIQEGLKHEYRDRVKSTVERVLRSELSTLTSEDFQDTDKRRQKSKDILPVLNEQLRDFYCVAEEVLIRRFRFSGEYEAKLQEKQYLEQKAFLDVALTGQANEQKTVNLIERQIVAAEKALTQDWEKRLQEKRSEYEVLIADIAAQAEVYSQKTRSEGEAIRDISIADGQLALDRAAALRNDLRTKALDSKGGRILLALDAAGNLKIPDVTLNSDDPKVPMLLDLGQLTGLLVGKDLHSIE